MRQSDSLRWVAPLELKAAVEKAYTERFGSKEEANKKAKAQAEQAKKVSRVRDRIARSERSGRVNCPLSGSC